MDAPWSEEEQPLTAEGFESEGESPYLRRQKAVKVRRRQRSWGWRGAILLALVVLPVGTYSTIFVLSSPRFELRSAEDIEVIGNHIVTRDEIAGELGLPSRPGSGPGMGLFRLSLEAQRKRLEEISWVRSAVVRRVFPNRLLIQVAERIPVAFVTVDGLVKLVDSDGVLLVRPGSLPLDFPVITGFAANTNLEQRRTRMALYQEFMNQLGEEISRSGWLLSETDLADGDDLKVLLVRGPETIQVHFGRENLREHFRTFLALLPELHRAGPLPDSVDLRYLNQVVVNPRRQAPDPTAPAVQTLKD